MPAPDLLTLMNLEDAVEPGVVAILESKSLTVCKQRDSGNLPTPRIEVQYQNGEVTGHIFPRRPIGMFDAWNGTIQFAIKTNRDTAAQAGVHQLYVATLRLAMCYAQGEFTRERFPFHSVIAIREVGTIPNVTEADCLDTTILQYACVVSIRQDAWPA